MQDQAATDEQAHRDLLRRALLACATFHEPSRAKLEACEASLAVGRAAAPAKVSKRQADVIVNAYASGQTVALIAQRLGLHRSTVTRALRRAGVPPRTSALTEASAQTVAHYYNSGYNVTDTARHFGVSKSTLIAYMEQHGIARRSRNAHRAYRDTSLQTV